MKGINKEHNLYIVKVYNKKDTLIKVGYSSNIINRLTNYYHHNPLIEVVTTLYREDALKLERELHKYISSEVMNEWYSVDKLDLILDIVYNKTQIPKKVKISSFKECCVKYKDCDEELKSIITDKYPLIKKAFDELGAEKIKALEYRKGKIEETLTITDKVKSKGYKVVQMLNYRVGQFVPSKEVKETLSSIYSKLNINATAKGSDLSNYYSVKEMRVSQDGNTVRGYKILMNKFKN